LFTFKYLTLTKLLQLKIISTLLIIILLLSSNKVFSQYNQKIYEKLFTVKEKIFNDEDQAKKSLDSLKPLLEKASVDSLWGLYYRTNSTLLSNQMEKDKAMEDLDRSIFYYQKAKNPKGIVLSMMNQGSILLFQGKIVTQTRHSKTIFLS